MSDAVAAARLHGVQSDERRSCASGKEGKSKAAQVTRRERVRVGMRGASSPLTCESPRALQLLYVCVTQFCNFSSLGNVGRKNRVWFNLRPSCLSLAYSPLSFPPCARRGNLDFLIRPSIRGVRTTRVGGKKSTGRDNLPAVVSGWRLSSPPENSVEMMWHV